MKNRRHPRVAALAALFVAAQLVACGGSSDSDEPVAGAPVDAPAPAPAPADPPAEAPAPASPLKVLDYDVLGVPGGPDTTDAGGVSEATANGATVSLGGAGALVLTVTDNGGDFVVSAPGYGVVSRFDGSVLMLCDAATTPGEGTARYVTVASSVAAGGVAAERVSDATALAGLRFFKMTNCSYQSDAGPQGQDTAADAQTLSIVFDDAGNAGSDVVGQTHTAAQFSDMLANGTKVGGSRFSAWRLLVDGAPQFVLVELGDPDDANAVPAYVKLWLPQ